MNDELPGTYVPKFHWGEGCTVVVILAGTATDAAPLIDVAQREVAAAAASAGLQIAARDLIVGTPTAGDPLP